LVTLVVILGILFAVVFFFLVFFFFFFLGRLSEEGLGIDRRVRRTRVEEFWTGSAHTIMVRRAGEPS
jgi:hypothetical protein